MDLTKSAASAAEAERIRKAEEAEANRLAARRFSGIVLIEQFKDRFDITLPEQEVLYLTDQATQAFAVVDGHDLVLLPAYRNVSPNRNGTTRSCFALHRETAAEADQEFVLLPRLRINSPKLDLTTPRDWSDTGPIKTLDDLHKIMAKSLSTYSGAKYTPGQGWDA